MIRRILLGLSTRATTGLFPVTAECRKEVLCSVNYFKHQKASFTSLVPKIISGQNYFQGITKYAQNVMFEHKQMQADQVRTVTKFSWKSGTRKTVGTIPRRFFRLHWGIWIRTIAGRNKKMWKKNSQRKNRGLNHVFCNKTQSTLLDKMVTKFWKKPKYYIEDPYEPYHKRENYKWSQTKPWRPEGCDYE